MTLIDNCYSSDRLNPDEMVFQPYFEQINNKYTDYKVVIRRNDFSRNLGVGIMNIRTKATATVWFRIGSRDINNPLKTEIMERLEQHLFSGSGDIEFNKSNT